MVVRQVRKYAVDKKYADELSKNIQKVADHDGYAKDKGFYIVRSLYFDDDKDTALKEREKDVDGREKFRLRIYNGNPDFVKLEKKIKINHVGTKTEAEITKEEAQKIIDGDYNWMEDKNNELISEFYGKVLNQGLRPKNIVEYKREPFVGDNELRITLDHYVKSGDNIDEFLNDDFSGNQLNDDISILEIKWPGEFPKELNSVLHLDRFREKDVSKYVITRKNIQDI